MALPPLALIGGGGHALVVAEAARLRGHVLAGFYDDAARADLAVRLHVHHLGLLSVLPHAFAPAQHAGHASHVANAHHAAPHSFILALGGLPVRALVLDRIGDALDARAATIVHPSAVVHTSATLEPGVYVGPNAVVHSFARVEAHAIINSGAIVEHECHVGRNSHIAPGAILAGRVRVGDHTLVGIGARVLPCLTIGSHCTIGAGAVVIHNLHDKSKVAGVPARHLE
jgi:sugar O-acyltransferase (sialic acid O-acetyltransferase NeuD family)